MQIIKSPFSIHWLQFAHGGGTLKVVITVQSWGRANFDAVGTLKRHANFQQWKMQHIVDSYFQQKLFISAWFFLLCK